MKALFKTSAVLLIAMLLGGCGSPSSVSTRRAGGPSVVTGTPIRYCVETARPGCGVRFVPGVKRPQIPTPTIGAHRDVTIVCSQDESTSGSTTEKWFYVRTTDGIVGFVPADDVTHGHATHLCAHEAGIYAAETAALFYGERTASGLGRSSFAAGEWAPGPVNEWAGDCVKLPFVGWERAGVRIWKSDAIQNYQHYRQLRMIRADVPPPVGAVVWYDIARPLGHEAIYLGNGMVASTQGLDGTGLRNVIAPYRQWPRYLGWWLPSRHFSSSRS